MAIDPVHNEVVMADENLFRIVLYERLENTPPQAGTSEPERIIVGWLDRAENLADGMFSASASL